MAEDIPTSPGILVGGSRSPTLRVLSSHNQRSHPPTHGHAHGEEHVREPLTPLPKTSAKDPPSSSRWGMFRRSSRSARTSNHYAPRTSLGSKSTSAVDRPLTATTSVTTICTTETLSVAPDAPLTPHSHTGVPPVPKLPPVPVTPRLVPKSSRISMRSNSKKKKNRSRPIVAADWQPPPLFQAYPQAIKHASLPATNWSADVVLRLSNHKRVTNLRTQMMRSAIDLDSTASRARKREEKALLKHKRKMSGSISKAEWTKKVYVLVTSGYLLQYAGDGEYDRLPERVLQLGEDSVAFVSDVIPGKHFVLQISQLADEDGSIEVENTKSLFGRLTFQKKSEVKRVSNTLLLVFENAKEMGEWMVAIRNEIEVMGGGNYVSGNTPAQAAPKDAHQLRQLPGRRYLTKRNPNQFSPAKDVAPPGVQAVDAEEQSPISTRRKSFRPSLETPSVSSVTVISNDQVQLDNLREGSRASYISSGNRTVTTSPGTSAACSPVTDQFTTMEDESQARTPTKSRAVMLAARGGRRQSMSAAVGNREDTIAYDRPPTANMQRPHSTYGAPDSVSTRDAPHSAPNFSVPNPRYSVSRIPPIPSPPPQHSIARRTPSAIGELPSLGSLKSSRSFQGQRSSAPFERQEVLTSQPLLPAHYYPNRLSTMHSLQQTQPRMRTPEAQPRRSSFSRPSSSATQKQFITYLPPGPRDPIVLDPPPKRYSALKQPRRVASESDDEFAEAIRDSYHHDAPYTDYRRPISELRQDSNTYDFPETRLRALPPSHALPPAPTLPPARTTSPRRPKTSYKSSSPPKALENIRSLRRPTSMMIQSPTQASPPKSQSTVVPPSYPKIGASRQAGRERKLEQRKSMPVLIRGLPPPAPPPNCPLPSLPEPAGVGVTVGGGDR
ncbi:MAG: hypothetical protein M1824_006003 [Vezdaea acicularis]|nr:MAG: hypothetical protein M1824_006003 [Vezdaea acicularis]